MKRITSGNEAIALGALHSGVKVVSGYPGTPSSEVIGSLWNGSFPETRIEWSVNEKVAFEVAAGAALVGYRALCTMKMSGVNVAYDSLIGIAYSGCTGGLVIYVADDPGVTAGMCEQDTRGFALMSDMPILEPGSVEESYRYIQLAFELSEHIGGPVFVRSVTNVAESHALIAVGERVPPKTGIPLPEKNIAKFTKAGALICMIQHRDLIERLAKSYRWIQDQGLHTLTLAQKGGLGIISVGLVNHYTSEALEDLQAAGVDTSAISRLSLAGTLPFAEDEIKSLLGHVGTLLVAEELEPHIEKQVYQIAYERKAAVKIFGKLDGTYRRIGEYDAAVLVRGVSKALGIPTPETFVPSGTEADKLAAPRPITFCAGCPHRGVYMSINNALRTLKYRREEVVITGDIGCTILGMNPPFNTLWTELSMGASIPLAQGILYTGTDKPVIATIGDSTFFHAGIAGLINAVQHKVNLTVVILDNGWTAMTGMQVNSGTAGAMQRDSSRRIDIARIVEGIGVDALSVIDPYNLNDMEEALNAAIPAAGVKVVLARRECAIQARRQKIRSVPVSLAEGKCTRCKVCINTTGCPAISLGEKTIAIDGTQCNGCGLCVQVCRQGALAKESA
ncbi:MAG: indolepyruvate ferredoxin oxidoreductase subunit alpha [Spirochaetaceae bacterium]|jgi:indolepyruvate ferredoxin oxidoreductase alpha subunit|nr:indolepyruvate ferredoxin oxidoreductase subunit alpha [Spirochaetaceae bacterium]